MRKVIWTVLSVLMLSMFLSMGAYADGSQEPVKYLDETGVERTVSEYTWVTNEIDYEILSKTLTTGWYVIGYSPSFDSVFALNRVTINGDVNIILMDTSVLFIPYGIDVPIGSSLTIYSQSTGDDQGIIETSLSVDVTPDCAAIGGTKGNSGTITINGGNITVKGGSNGAGIGGGNGGGATVTINGGIINATGGDNGAGIGGGLYGGGTVTINGGTVNATGGYNGAGIGGGLSQGNNTTFVTITGGNITATGKGNGSGIGGGNKGRATIIISGGTIKATAEGYAPGIGNGYLGTRDTKTDKNIEISGGTIEATSSYGAGIGNGNGENESNVNAVALSIYISGGKITAKGAAGSAGIGSGAFADIGNITVTGGEIDARGADGGAGIGSGKYANNIGIISIEGGKINAVSKKSNPGFAYSGAGIGEGHWYSHPDTVAIRVSCIPNGRIYAEGDDNAFIGQISLEGKKDGFAPSVYYDGKLLYRNLSDKEEKPNIINDNNKYIIVADPLITYSNGKLLGEYSAYTTYLKAEEYVPSKQEHYDFGGWYKDNKLTEAFDFEKDVTEPMTLYAKWNPKEYTVSFASNGGTAVNSVKYKYESKLSKPSDPVREGYVFVGWYTDEALTKAFSFDTVPSGNFTLYAKWIIPDYDISKDEIKANSLTLGTKFTVKESGGKLTVKWGKVKDADYYYVYSNKCDKGFKVKPVKIAKSKTSTTIKKVGSSKVKSTDNYEVYVSAVKLYYGKEYEIGKTVAAHIAGSKSKTYTNASKINAKSSYTVKKGKTIKLGATVKKADAKKKLLPKKHAAELRYEVSDKKISVDKNGKVKGKTKGTAYVYIIAQNGTCKKVKVTVK